MNIQVTTRHFNGSAELQENVKAEIQKIQKFNDSIKDVHVILDAENKLRKSAEILINISDKTICASSEAENMHKAIELVLLKVQRRLKKENQKHKGHRAQSIVELIESDLSIEGIENQRSIH